MSKIKFFGLALMLAVGFTGKAEADPHSHHYHGGYWGGHHYWRPGFRWYVRPYYYPRPYYPAPLYYPYYAPGVVVVPEKPPVYIQRSPRPAQQPLPSGYWYYCNNPEGYYPHVSECPGGWRQVNPVPPPSR